MTSPSTAEIHPVPRKYRRPRHALVWSFRKSRDNWERKYLDVKATLRLAQRRLDRLAKAPPPSPSRPAPPPPAPSADHAPSASAPPSCLAALRQALLALRQPVQANRELLEQGQQQRASLTPVEELFKQASTQDVRAWIKEDLGLTVQAARRRLGLAFQKAQQKRNQPPLALT